MAGLIFVTYGIRHVHAVNRLAARLRERIAASGPISFSAFMESALYDAEDGFYARGARLGARGAFTTAPIAAPFFARGAGRRPARRLGAPRPAGAVHARRGRPGRRHAGGGPRAPSWPTCRSSSCSATAPRACSRRRGRVFPARASPSSRSCAGVHGAIVANEVHDACPAHRLRWPDELLVGVGPDGRFRCRPRPAGRRASASRCGRRGDSRRDGAEYEVSPAQAELQRALARALARGALYRARLRRGGRRALRAPRSAPAHLPRRAWPAAIRCRRPGRRTSRSTSTSAPCAPPARPRACARRSTSRRPSGCSRAAPAPAVAALPRHDPSGSGSRR